MALAKTARTKSSDFPLAWPCVRTPCAKVLKGTFDNEQNLLFDNLGGSDGSKIKQQTKFKKPTGKNQKKKKKAREKNNKKIPAKNMEFEKGEQKRKSAYFLFLFSLGLDSTYNFPNGTYKLPGFALSVALNSNDKAALSYLEKARFSTNGPEIVFWKVRKKKQKKKNVFWWHFWNIGRHL